MNCEKCQELLSDFLDDAVSESDRASFGAHLEECLPCYNVHAELNSIVSFCRDSRGQYDSPPNEQALWLRILNTVEASAPAAAAAQGPSRAARREGWLARATRRSWELSFAQVAGAVVAIVVFASLATLLGLRGLRGGAAAGNNATADLNGSGGRAMALTGERKGLRERLPLQQHQIDYLTGVVEQRKAHWNPQVRADFERNLGLLDETVNESLQRLSEHPHDEVTEEMLNAALNDKVQLLQEFSDL